LAIRSTEKIHAFEITMALLEVTVVEATNLLQKNKLKKNNSFVRLYLGNKNQKTNVIKNSNDPTWNEVFVLYVYFLFYLIILYFSLNLVMISNDKMFFTSVFILKMSRKIKSSLPYQSS
jgi:hypothetical protein